MPMIHFLKNLAIMGGLLECVALGAGAMSLDTLRAPQHPGESPFWPQANQPS